METQLLNRYRHADCPVTPGIAWADVYPSEVDTECPACGTDISPYASDDIRHDEGTDTAESTSDASDDSAAYRYTVAIQTKQKLTPEQVTELAAHLGAQLESVEDSTIATVEIARTEVTAIPSDDSAVKMKAFLLEALLHQCGYFDGQDTLDASRLVSWYTDWRTRLRDANLNLRPPHAPVKRLQPTDIVRTALSEYHVVDLMRWAADWHMGQGTALHAFASMGIVRPGLAAEVRECATHPTTKGLWFGRNQEDLMNAIASLDA